MINQESVEVCDEVKVHPEVIEELEDKTLDNDCSNELAEFFKVYSDPTRLKIIHLLSIKEICVCDIAETLNITQSATSHQLKLLRSHKLVKSRKDGKQVFYSLDDDHILQILKAGIEHINE